MDPFAPQNPPQDHGQTPPMPPPGGWHDPFAQLPVPQSGYTSYPSPPPYTNQPDFVYPPLPRSKKGLWIGIGSGIALVLVIVSIATYMYQTSPLATLNRYCDAMRNYDAIGYYDVTGTNDKSNNKSLQSIQEFFVNLKQQGIVIGCRDATIVRQSDSIATGTVVLLISTGGDLQPLTNGGPAEVQLFKEDGKWKVRVF